MTATSTTTAGKVANNFLGKAGVEKVLNDFMNKPAWADEYWVDPRIEYPAPQFSLFQDNTGFLPLGDFQLIKAKKKSGKTYLCSIYAASLLGCTSFGFRSAVESPRIIIFDTEQSKENAARVDGRIRQLAGIDTHTITEKINVFDLRPIPAKDRLAYIRAKMAVIKPTHVFLDGIVDLGFDYMNSASSTALMTELLTMCRGKDYTCAIIGVLHTNKSEDDHNGRGFLGTEAGNKCSEETEVTRRKGMDTVFDVTMTDSRNKPITPWSFSLDGDGMPFLTANVQENKDLARLNELSELIKACFQQTGKTEMKSKDLTDAIKANRHCCTKTAYKKLDDAERAGLVQCVTLIGREKWYKRADWQ